MSHDIKEMMEFGKDLKVLFVEDNQEVRLQLKKLLKNFFYSIDESEDGIHAFEMYENFKIKTDSFYDLVITDISMPRLSGIELSKKMIEKNPNQLILIMSAHTESEKLIELIDIGIYKFVQKPIDHTVLLDSLCSVIRKIKKQKKFMEMEKKFKEIKDNNTILNKMAITDKLTSIYNRRYIDNKLFESFQNLESFSQKELSVIFIDIDDFKQINDNFGHITGDEVLITFSHIIKKHITNEIFGRWGGEEFIIICNNKNLQQSFNLAEKIRISLEEYKFNKVHKLTASFGIASYEKGDSVSKLLEKADSNLYIAKDNGKNRVIV
ncbi:GGDEF domain-containing response regulator [Halarcobacter anaerophilus]|jgi:diguanylate cyclase (GGDEF)-like protein|uniref:diguanylate cyclase n=1 Tax=Halarcobacter anaerophilus TaxID=877500 RepID=A0A4Q0Y231_9BACT|nr:diguanylate cyclase [Halarcobacter anaerophilus]QDF28875.1 diguanylate cyclase [Halarcobacter anaerophilus]RXJ63515.1 diguanylate cyclase response regulator [Halarcobacter anaerophilus]